MIQEATPTSAVENNSRSNRSRSSAGGEDNLTRLKRELMQAEVRLARARATVVGAEIDIRVLSQQLKALAK